MRVFRPRRGGSTSWIPLIPLITTLACAPELSWTRPETTELHGVVRFEVAVEGADAVDAVDYYLDGSVASELIATGTGTEGAFAVDWLSTEVANGAHEIIAVARQGGEEIARATLEIRLVNLDRDSSIPADVVKQTPGTDPHPPLLSPAFQSVFEPCVPMPAPLNSAGAEDSPFISPDGTQMTFFFTPDAEVPVNLQLVDRATGIYHAVHDGSAWSVPVRVHLNYFDDPALDGCPTLLGDTLWFCSARVGNLREIDMYTARWQDPRWTDWSNAGAGLNVERGIGELHLSADGNAIYYDSGLLDGQGQKDIYVVRRQGEGWSVPEPIVAVNSAENEGWPFVNEAEDELWFSRTVGAPNVMRSLKVAGVWQAPEEVASPFAGEPTLDRAGNLYFIHHFWDDASSRILDADIYMCARR